ncbi:MULTISPECIES: GLPGLI family protein [Empedobacter]|uniref:GLPGLI family protein n=1 Tax=Empedobacter falsenii TaxID=343874 RepID=A0A376FZ62_9FLAO|nr:MULTISPECIES: GLPGLI family protein [Empedobacter]MBW1617863.1 GLPGLI family protein [Empedobacter falsenii]RRT87340.1 GLPGLI family protein [Empedobacter falsenii]RRT88507.1 GLPGLI family protein [Empedobacter falsenii]STD53659.1 GLPGLI family protein [Empedobacter falsenii]
MNNKLNNFFLIFLLGFSLINAQNYHVIYTQKINFDNFNFENVNAKYYDLYVNNKESLYIENKELKDTIKLKKVDGEINLTKERTATQKLFYFNKNNTDFYINSYISNEDNYLVRDVFEHNWKIENETKMILNQKCQKASTSFRGRNYTAWFSTKIKYPFGPWKMNGLPGIILEVYDDQNFFKIDAVKISKDHFDFDDFVKNTNLNSSITMQEYKVKQNQKSEEILNQLRKTNPNIKLDKNCDTCNKSLEIF